MIYRVRKQLVEEGFEAVLSHKQRATPAIARIFDGEQEAKLIALACSKPPKGRARWTLRLLEKKVVELRIVDRASDSTIGRALKFLTEADNLSRPRLGERLGSPFFEERQPLDELWDNVEPPTPPKLQHSPSEAEPRCLPRVKA